MLKKIGSLDHSGLSYLCAGSVRNAHWTRR
ncbi:hypothetical protein E2C01_074251 [Portunus trituberculatus]|uniref:Uncharacterized protein n=1 Tax=Portunus trituberculatus TaxID=210409 RepID=A0A5B7I577_PORTR|nr:hypothetical protein [Portunus trituberculatus]